MQNIYDLIKSRDVEGIKAFMAEHDLVLDGTKIVPRNELVAKKLKALASFWNQRQQARKILLNSLYGALLNEGLRFYDERIGQSTTLSGRTIVQHMNGKTNEAITGIYDYTGKGIVYADTDSCYFSAYEALHDDPAYQEIDWNDRDSVIALYDGIADAVNDSFPAFMVKTFNTSLERGAIIKAGRELVASTGLFIKKKKYAVLMYDYEGDRQDLGNKPGKLKAMGLDLKRADTPKFMQTFLENVLMDLLTGAQKPEIFAQIKDFRAAFKDDRPAWEKGSPKKVSDLTKYSTKLSDSEAIKPTSAKVAGSGKVTMPGHVRASLNWNKLCEVYDDRYVQRITDGTRIVVCKLKPNNALRMDSVAYPTDEPHLPQWFLKLPFDQNAMEQTIIDNKIDNLLGVMDWDLADTIAHPGDEFFVFGGKK